ncbi:MAG: hypothetical protein ACYTFY_11920 [Planctomycetota bacterium]|jgi:hypothetical protein
MKFIFKLITLTVMLLGLPMLGVWIYDLPIERYLEFPPRTVYIFPAQFNLIAAIGFVLFFCGWIIPFVLQYFRYEKVQVEEKCNYKKCFPAWGGIALILTLFFWWLAWTRQPWMKDVQIHTFTPIWLGFIVIVNALQVRVKGSCLMLEKPKQFLLLFPTSAAFWWFFEYLNRFVQNWHYRGENLDGLDYFLAATLPFSTVLPAVLSVRELLMSYPRFSEPFKSFNALNIKRPKALALLIFVFTALSLFFLGIMPDYLFGCLWVSPLLIIVSLKTMLGEKTVFSPVAKGDWRIIVTSACAALICGFFWEMWNYYSLARWIYAVPYVQTAHIFEMPLIGFGGYLPFGLECSVVAGFVFGGESLTTERLRAGSARNPKTETTNYANFTNRKV